MHAKSTDQLIIQWSLSPKFGLSEAIRWVQTKTDFTFWLIFGLSPNLGLSKSLSESLIQKVKWFNVSTKKQSQLLFSVATIHLHLFGSILVEHRNFLYPFAFDGPVEPRRNISIPFGVWKLEWCGYPMVKKFEEMSNRFDRILECDRRTTDRQTSFDGIVRAMHSIAR